MRGLLLILIMMGVIPMSFVEPFIGLAAWTLLSDMNPYRLVWGIAAEIHWVLLIALITLVSMLIHRESLQRVHWNGAAIALMMFTLLAIASTATAIFPAFASHELSLWMKEIVLVLAIMVLVTSPVRAHWLIWIFVVSIGFYAVKGGIFTIAHGGHYHVLGPGGSFIGDNNQLALAMCMVLPLMRYLHIHTVTRWLRWALFLAMALTTVAVFGTYSRGGLITLAAVLILLTLKSRKRLGLLVVLVFAAVFAVNFLPHKWAHRMDGLQSGSAVKGKSFDGRVISWKFATNVALHHPFVGGGYGVWASVSAWQTYGPPHYRQILQRKGLAIHSIWFKVLAEMGFTGLLLYVLILLLSWRRLYKIRNQVRGQPHQLWLYDLCGYLQVSLFAYALGGSALPVSYFNFTFQLVALIVALEKIAMSKSALPVARGLASIRPDSHGPVVRQPVYRMMK